jgi:hypothetical protein
MEIKNLHLVHILVGFLAMAELIELLRKVLQ